ncbi:MAG TPA: hypothetical protein VK970_22895 [Candidatus Methylacidiphilales bacterium]|nr:hypothetical protein [Candidatus Methylacidiphilales bacterium]
MTPVIKDPMTEDLREQDGFYKKTALYQEFLAERDEILKHKWIESEKAGCDIGWEKALLDWIVRHRSAWRNSRRRNSDRKRY